MALKLTDTCPDETTRVEVKSRTNTCDGCVGKDDRVLCDDLGMECAKPKFHMWYVWQENPDD